MARRSHRRYHRLGDADVTGGSPLRITPGTRFSLESDKPADRPGSDFGPSEPLLPGLAPAREEAPVRGEAPAKKEKVGKFFPQLTPQVGDKLMGVGLLLAVGGVGYYIWKGGDIARLWDLIKPGRTFSKAIVTKKNIGPVKFQAQTKKKAYAQFMRR